MWSENARFEVVVIVAGGVVLGIAFLLGAMLVVLSDEGDSVLLLAGSVPVTTTVGVLLLLTAGFLGTGHRHGRYVGMMAFGAVAVFGRPTLASPEPLLFAQVGLAIVVGLYMVVRNPVPAPERSNVDESTSATKVGSTIR